MRNSVERAFNRIMTYQQYIHQCRRLTPVATIHPVYTQQKQQRHQQNNMKLVFVVPFQQATH